MMKQLYAAIILVCLFSGTLSVAQTVSPKYEYRAVWVTAIENLDWPRTQVRTPSDIPLQQNELSLMLDSLQAMNVNTVLLQTRIRGDVIYPSNIEPFSKVFTGTPGKSPGYDPLAFAIEECHKRGMQLHAWLVAMPLGKESHVRLQGGLALSRRSPSLCTRYRGEWYMEPGNPATDSHLLSLVSEIVENYEIDGLHLDYIRYPDRTAGYPDGALHRKHGKGHSLAAWRRGNITRIVSKVYRRVKELKPWVRVSCAPLGKHDDLARYSSLGWNAYDAVYQEAQEWMRIGVMDILFPMLYFSGNNFYPFVLDWQENINGRHLVPGIGAYRLLPEYGGWNPVEIERQLATSRSAGAAGTAMFRASHLLGCSAETYSKIYSKPALVPPMEWVGNAPVAPSGLVAVRDSAGITLRWNRVTAQEGFPAVRYNIYAAVGDTLDLSVTDNLVASSLSGTSFRWGCAMHKDIAVAVTAVNACGVESEASSVSLSGGTTSLVSCGIELPEADSWGWNVEIIDIYGRTFYKGRYARKANLQGLPPGHYILNVYDRHGSLRYNRRFATL